MKHWRSSWHYRLTPRPRRVAWSVLATCLLANPGRLAGATPTPTEPARWLQLGKFADARQGFETLADKYPDDLRWRYNAGVAAFRSGDAAAAHRHFEAATASPDLELQHKAWYNLGHTWFTQATVPEAEDREKSLKNAAEAFGAALQLDPNDSLAVANLAAVKRFEEELKKQQQQQENPSQDSKDKKNQKDQKDSKNQKGQKGQDDPQKPENAGKDSESSDSEDGSGKNGADRKDSAKDQAGKSGDSKDRKDSGKEDGAKDSAADQARQQTNRPSAGSPTNQLAQSGPKKDESKGSDIQRADGNEAAGAAGGAAGALEPGDRMTMAQAMQLLDAQKASEKPVWTLVRGWGQEKDPPANASGRRRKW